MTYRKILPVLFAVLIMFADATLIRCDDTNLLNFHEAVASAKTGNPETQAASPQSSDSITDKPEKYFGTDEFEYERRGVPHPLLGRGVISPVLKPWYELKNDMTEGVGLHTDFFYTVYSQWASKTRSVPGKATPDSITGGRLDLLGYWELPQNALGRSRVHFLMRQGTNYGWSTGTTLDTSIGDVSGVNDLYNPSICLNTLSFEQEFLDGRVTVEIGKVGPSWKFFCNPVASDESSQFMNADLTDNPSWLVANYAPGMIVQINELFGSRDFYLYAAGIDMGDTETTALGGMDKGRWGTIYEFGWTPKFGKLQGHYRFDYWYADNREFDSGSGSGFGINFDQEIITDWIAFVTYAYNSRQSYDQTHQLTAGLGVLEPFDRDGEMFGIAGGWSQASENRQNEYLIETFYRFQLTEAVQFSPDLQLIFNPADAPDTNCCAVLGARFKIQF